MILNRPSVLLRVHLGWMRPRRFGNQTISGQAATCTRHPLNRAWNLPGVERLGSFAWLLMRYRFLPRAETTVDCWTVTAELFLVLPLSRRAHWFHLHQMR